MKQYVLGFAFSRDKMDIILISKLKSQWQKGKLNGVGGKVEPGEKRFYAMIREFKEETGVDTNITQWEMYAKMVFKDDITGVPSEIHCFKLFNNLIYECKTIEEEEIIRVAVDTALTKLPVMGNLPILIRLALSNEFTYSELSDGINQVS